MSAPPTSRCRILVVDGDERERDGAARALTEAGHAVDTAATRADVVSLLGERAYDLVLSDLKMPALNGTRLLPVAEGFVSRRHAARHLLDRARVYARVCVLPDAARGSRSHEAGSRRRSPPGRRANAAATRRGERLAHVLITSGDAPVGRGHRVLIDTLFDCHLTSRGIALGSLEEDRFDPARRQAQAHAAAEHGGDPPSEGDAARSRESAHHRPAEEQAPRELTTSD